MCVPPLRTTRQGEDNPLTPPPAQCRVSFLRLIALEIPPSARVPAQLLGSQRQQTGHGNRGGAHQAHEAGLYVSADIGDWLAAVRKPCVCKYVSSAVVYFPGVVARNVCFRCRRCRWSCCCLLCCCGCSRVAVAATATVIVASCGRAARGYALEVFAVRGGRDIYGVRLFFNLRK